MSKQLIVIGGTPGTGKTVVAKLLSKRLKTDVVQLGELAEKSGCVKEFDGPRDTGVIDEDCLVDAIIKVIDEVEDNLIVEGHYVDLIPSASVWITIILRTHPASLKKRLQDRDYSENKINENVESEIIGVCQLDALDAFGEDLVFEIDNSENTVDETVTQIMHMLEDNSKPIRYDWMSLLEEEGTLDKYLKTK
ncbi:MAG: adenylate kinase family protein [Candidatus Thorarchaeota archaeon]